MSLVQWVAPWGALVGMVFFIIGFVVQDWECSRSTGGGYNAPDGQDCSRWTGGGYDDHTWGTIATDWGITAAYIPMAILAPGTGVARAGFRGAAAFDALAWYLAGLAHFIKAKTGVFHVPLFIASEVGTTIGRTMRFFGAVVAMQNVGLCTCIRDTWALGAVFGCVVLSAAALIPLAEVGAIQVPGFMVAAVYQSMLVLLFCIFSTSAVVNIRVKHIWAPVVALLMFVWGLLVSLIKPSPFKYSTEFNDNGLFHVFFILEAAVSFQVLRVLSEPLTSEHGYEPYAYDDIRKKEYLVYTHRS